MSGLDALKQTLANVNEAPSGNENGSDIRWWKLPFDHERDGQKLTYTVRLLPAWQGSTAPFKIVAKHYQMIGEKSSRPCMRMYGLPCQLCDVLEKFKDKLDIDTWASSVRPQCNALVLNDPVAPGKYDPTHPHVFGSPYGFLTFCIAAMEDPTTSSFVDPRNGRNLTIQREQYKGKVNVNFAFNASPVAETEEDIEAILSKLYNLDKIWKPADDATIKGVAEAALALEEVLNNRLAVAGTAVATQPAQQQQTTQQQTTQQQNTQQTTQQAAGSGFPDQQQAAATEPAATQPAGSGFPDQQQQQQQQQTVQPVETAAQPVETAAQPQATSTTATATDRPPNADQCWGDANTWDENADKCIECVDEFSCRKAIGK